MAPPIRVNRLGRRRGSGLCDEVEATQGDRGRAVFRSLVRLLAVHENTEREAVHILTGARCRVECRW